jgi:UDP-2,3-diacylglucosamine pyrophosphatase LpxH
MNTTFSIKKLNKNKPLLFLGDHHGEWRFLFDIIREKNIENCNIISVGDLGIGFKYKKESEYSQSEKLSNMFKEKNINFYGIAGNHDNRFFFEGKNRIVYENFELFEDYTVAEYNGKTIQFIGGAISIDRTGRREGISYWEDEKVVFDKDKCQKVDILVTHTAPSWCFPQQFNEMVYGWAREDAYLLEDLTDERAVMDEIFKICKPSLHLYGHFHTSVTERINGCIHKLLDINEIWESQYK